MHWENARKIFGGRGIELGMDIWAGIWAKGNAGVRVEVYRVRHVCVAGTGQPGIRLERKMGLEQRWR